MNSRLGASIDRALGRAASVSLDHPRLTIWITLLLVLASIAAGFTLRFKADVTDLMPASTVEAHRVLQHVLGAGDSAFALITASRPAAAELLQVAQDAASQLESLPQIRSVSFGYSGLADKMTSPELLSKATLFAGKQSLDELRALLTPRGIAAQVEKQALQLGLPGLGEAEAWARRDPLELRRFLVARTAPLRGGFRFLPGSLHFLSEDARSILIRIDGRIPCSDIEAVKKIMPSIEVALRNAIGRVEAAAPPLRLGLGLTGGYAFAREMEASVRADLTWNNTGSMLLCLALVAIAYRSFSLVLPSVLALVAGMVLGFGAYTLLQRDLVTLAFVSGAALAGLGIDYVIYVTLRAFSDPRGPSRESVIEAVEATGRPILLAAVSTAAGFLTFPLAGERFLSDVGLLSSVGILACAASAIVILPALLVPWIRRAEKLRAQGVDVRMREPTDFGASWLAALGLRFPRASFWLSLASAVLGTLYLCLRPPVLEKDLRKMQPAGSEAVRTQQAITETFGGAESPVLVILKATSPSEVGASRTASDRTPEIAAVEAAARLDGPLEDLLASGAIAAWASPTCLVPAPLEQAAVLEVLRSLDPEALVQALRVSLEENGFELAELGTVVDTFAQAIRPGGIVTPDFLRGLSLGAEIDKLLGQENDTGYALVSVHPAQQLWQAEDQERLTGALEAALRNSGTEGIVTGLQVLSARQASGLLQEFLRVSAAATIAVVVIVVAYFRGAAESALALLPLFLGTLWMMLGCQWLDIPLNFMNVGVLPMVLGTGVDIGVHLAAQCIDEPDGDVEKVVRHAGGSIMLASLTTLASFGTMIWSTSPGLVSVGTMSTLGTVGCLVATLVTLPAALILYVNRRRRTQAAPKAGAAE